METVELDYQDGGTLQITDEVSTIKYAKRTYFEVEIIKKGNIVIEVLTSDDSILYDFLRGDVVCSSSYLVLNGTPLSDGDILGVNIWTVDNRDEVQESFCEFSVNGNVTCGRSVPILGTDIKVLLGFEGETTIFKANVGSMPFKFDQGKDHDKTIKFFEIQLNLSHFLQCMIV